MDKDITDNLCLYDIIIFKFQDELTVDTITGIESTTTASGKSIIYSTARGCSVKSSYVKKFLGNMSIIKRELDKKEKEKGKEKDTSYKQTNHINYHI